MARERADKCYCGKYEGHFGACGSKWCFCHGANVKAAQGCEWVVRGSGRRAEQCGAYSGLAAVPPSDPDDDAPDLHYCGFHAAQLQRFLDGC